MMIDARPKGGALARVGSGAGNFWATGTSPPARNSVATLEQIRGGEDPVGWQRIVAGEEHATTGLTRLRLDAGPRLLLEGATFTLALAEGAPTLTLSAGRAFVEVLEGDALTIHLGDHVLQLRHAQASISADGDVYVVRGEIADRLGESDERQVIAAGERMSVSSGAIEAATLWDDWTGGLAEPGPGLAEEAAIGALEGRVPDEIGQARWPLVIRRLEVRVRVVENLAITEVDEIFFNPASETVEGLYRIRVPEGAVLQRFAVDRNGRMVDGYVREKAQAQQAYEAQVYRGSTLDPALLEWVAPGRYRARIYPIAAGEERRISVRYAEWLERPSAGGARVYRFPMGSDGDAPRVQELSFEADLSQAVSGDASQVRVGSGAEIDGDTVRLRQSDVRPRADIEGLGTPDERVRRQAITLTREARAAAFDLTSAGLTASEPTRDLP